MSDQLLKELADELGITVEELKRRPKPPAGSHTNNGLSFQELVGESIDLPLEQAIRKLLNHQIPPGQAKAVAANRNRRLARRSKTAAQNAQNARPTRRHHAYEPFRDWALARNVLPTIGQSDLWCSQNFDPPPSTSTVKGWLRELRNRKGK